MFIIYPKKKQNPRTCTYHKVGNNGRIHGKKIREDKIKNLYLASCFVLLFHFLTMMIHEEFNQKIIEVFVMCTFGGVVENRHM